MLLFPFKTTLPCPVIICLCKKSLYLSFINPLKVLEVAAPVPALLTAAMSLPSSSWDTLPSQQEQEATSTQTPGDLQCSRALCRIPAPRAEPAVLAASPKQIRLQLPHSFPHLAFHALNVEASSSFLASRAVSWPFPISQECKQSRALPSEQHKLSRGRGSPSMTKYGQENPVCLRWDKERKEKHLLPSKEDLAGSSPGYTLPPQQQLGIENGFQLGETRAGNWFQSCQAPGLLWGSLHCPGVTLLRQALRRGIWALSLAFQRALL